MRRNPYITLPVLALAGLCSAQPTCETDKLVAGDGAAGDDFGATVAVDGAIAVVGIPVLAR